MYMCRCICVCVNMYIYISIYMYVHKNVCVCVYVNIYVCTYACVCVYVYMYMCICVCVCVYVCVYICAKLVAQGIYPLGSTAQQTTIAYEGSRIHSFFHPLRLNLASRALGHERIADTTTNSEGPTWQDWVMHPLSHALYPRGYAQGSSSSHSKGTLQAHCSCYQSMHS